MYRVVALLGLLVTPAPAHELYTARECETLAMEFTCGPSWAGGARRFDEIRKKHKIWALCSKYKTGFSRPKKRSMNCGARSVMAKSPRNMRSINTAPTTGPRCSSRPRMRPIPTPNVTARRSRC